MAIIAKSSMHFEADTEREFFARMNDNPLPAGVNVFVVETKEQWHISGGFTITRIGGGENATLNAPYFGQSQKDSGGI